MALRIVKKLNTNTMNYLKDSLCFFFSVRYHNRKQKFLLPLIPLKPFQVLKKFSSKINKVKLVAANENEKIILYHQLTGFECKRNHVSDDLGVP